MLPEIVKSEESIKEYLLYLDCILQSPVLSWKMSIFLHVVKILKF